MRDLRLVISPSAYEIALDGTLLGRLDGGAGALLAGAGNPLRELDLEIAIERAEEWLMRFSKSLSGLELEVRDTAGTLRKYLGTPAVYTAQAVEQTFARVHDAVVHRRMPGREAAADIVLLRELVHHGRLAAIKVLDDGPHPQAPRSPA